MEDRAHESATCLHCSYMAYALSKLKVTRSKIPDLRYYRGACMPFGGACYCGVGSFEGGGRELHVYFVWLILKSCNFQLPQVCNHYQVHGAKVEVIYNGGVLTRSSCCLLALALRHPRRRHCQDGVGG